MAPNRYYSSNAVETTLTSPISNSATTIQVASVTGYPTSFPFTIQVELGTSNEEIIEVTNVAGTTLTVVRGVDGSSALSHSAGATVVHGVSARDFREPQEHLGEDLGIHGLGPSTAVVGTDTVQTLSNKTLTSPVLLTPTIADLTNVQHDHSGASDGGSALGTIGAPVTLGGAPALTDYTNAGHNHSNAATGGSTLGPVTLTGQPTIADLTNAQHDHSAANKGGAVPQASITGLSTRLTNIEAVDTAQSGRLTTIETAPFCSLARTTDQNIPDSTATAMSWNTETEDSANAHSGTNPTRMTCMRAGVYALSAAIPWDLNSSTMKYETYFSINGSTLINGTALMKTTSSITVVTTATAIVRLALTDYVEVIVWQNSGGTLAVTTFHNGPVFQGIWMRP